MIELTILRDTREQKPWEFKNQPTEIEDVTLETGDYTLAEFCEYDSDLDTYYPEYGIERKSGDDFVNSIGNNRDRFKEEIKRAGDWDSPLLVLIEDTKNPGRYSDNHFLNFTQMDRGQIFGTVESWERHYNVSFQFAGSRTKAQQIAHDTLLTQLRARLM
jgi:hypothetical protein